MSRSPKTPTSPSQVPQQRISEVVSLPSRPALFDFKVGYGNFTPDIVPKQGVPRSPELLVQVEWAESPRNNGINAFYLRARKKYWVLWLHTFDDNSHPWRWNWQAIGYPFAPDGWPKRLVGHSELRGHMHDYPEHLDVRRFKDLTIHETHDPEVIVAEVTAEGVVTATGQPYEVRYIDVITVRGGRFMHYRDYWNPMLATQLAPQGLGHC
jgi:ketosteroid isomerase-like protein